MKYFLSIVLLCLMLSAFTQEHQRLRIGTGGARYWVSTLIESEDERTWAGTARHDFGILDLQFRLHDRWYIGAEGAWFRRFRGTDYRGTNYDHYMFTMGGDIQLPVFRSKHSQHRINLGGQVEFGRIGGATDRFDNWVWQRGGSIVLSYYGGSPFVGFIRSSYRHHFDSDGSGSGLRLSFRLVGFGIGVQYKFWNR